MSDYLPSMNRGPGAVDREEAKTLRQEISQHETTSKKRKVQLAGAVDSGNSLALSAQLVGGTGAVVGGYLIGRNRYSKKGRTIGPNTQVSLDSVFGAGKGVVCEAIAKQAMPKYNVGPGFAVGTNNSPGMEPRKAVKIGFKSQLRGPIDPARGRRLATHAVNMINFFEAELQNETPAGPPPTRDEVMAAMQLALLDGWANRALPQQHRNPVNNNFNAL